MYKIYFLTLLTPFILMAFTIQQTPIKFEEKRIELTKEYIKIHYKLDVKDIKIIPKIIVVHHTAIDSYEKSLGRFKSQILPTDRPEIAAAGAVNVSAHFMIEKNGTIHQLMPLIFMARHVIGLNYNAIGIENVGGENSVDNLTKKQLEANIYLVKYLQNKFKTIKYLIGHYEYRCFEKDKLFLELDPNYRTKKDDPSPRFMNELRENIQDLKAAPCKILDD